MQAELIPHTHDELVAIGAKYLQDHRTILGRRLPGHSIITTGIGSGETPDIIGFYGSGASTLIEVKVSRADFRADAKKSFRREPGRGMGNTRYYLAPKGLLKPEELPIKWGLMEAFNGKIKVVKLAEHQEAAKNGEMSVLMSLIRRIGRNSPEGVSVKFYIYETKNTCTAGLDIEDNKQKGGNHGAV